MREKRGRDRGRRRRNDAICLGVSREGNGGAEGVKKEGVGEGSRVGDGRR